MGKTLLGCNKGGLPGAPDRGRPTWPDDRRSTGPTISALRTSGRLLVLLCVSTAVENTSMASEASVTLPRFHGRHWWRGLSSEAIFSLPKTTPSEVSTARKLLAQFGAVPFDDPVGHSGALGMFRAHLDALCRQPPTKAELNAAVRRCCGRPGFGVEVHSAHQPGPRWAWIPPHSITWQTLGQPFKPYHTSTRGIAALAGRILAERSDPGGLLELFGEPRAWLPCIVVDSFPGPNGPVRVVTTNGNHRTVALQALEAPLVLAEITYVVPPYRFDTHPTLGWDDTWRFVCWLAEHNAVRLSARPLGQTRFSRVIRVADTPAPWLVAHPADAFVALDAYQTITGRPLTRVGGVRVSELRSRWSGVARPIDEERITAIASSHAPRSEQERPVHPLK